MGALHAGHLSLVERSIQECERTVATIFVNPTQFGPNEDFSRYPRTLEDDLSALRALEVDLVLTPSHEVLYPAGFSTFVEPPEVSKPLEGVFRPGHFRGVATVVLKLFQILPASVAYFGQKDYQQLAVIRQMVSDFNVPIRIQGCPTLRESDGLAMSSRNRYLSETQRRAALSLWLSLQATKRLVEDGEREVARLESNMSEVLLQHGAESIDYARVVDADTLSEIQTIQSSAIALIAARIGQTRLIDNLLLT
jgi:pantoate--beta-alanine ligase